MLEQVLVHIHNWFERDYVWSEWKIEGGALDLPHVQEGQYFRITGSVFNDGLHQYPAKDLKDEIFTGSIYGLAIPKSVIDLAYEIKEWQDKNGSAADSPFSSESFENYSYSKASNASNSGDSLSGWQKAFSGRLNPYRKLC